MCARLRAVVRDVRDVGGQVNAHQGFLCPCETLSEIAPDNTTIQRAWHARRGFRWVKRGGRAAPAGGTRENRRGGFRADTEISPILEGCFATPLPRLRACACTRPLCVAMREGGGPPFSQSQTCLYPATFTLFSLFLSTTYRSQPRGVPRLKSFHVQILESWQSCGLNCSRKKEEESLYVLSRGNKCTI